MHLAPYIHSWILRKMFAIKCNQYLPNHFPALISLQKACPEHTTDVNNVIWLKYTWIRAIFTIILHNMLFHMNQREKRKKVVIAASSMHFVTGVNQKLASWLAGFDHPLPIYFSLFLPRVRYWSLTPDCCAGQTREDTWQFPSDY